MSLSGSQMREERDKIWKEFQEQRYKLGLCKSREKKKIQEILQGDGTRVLVVHTSVRTPTTQLAHSVCHVHPQERGPRRTSSHRGSQWCPKDSL